MVQMAVEASVAQLIRTGVVHADPHEGNLIYTEVLPQPSLRGPVHCQKGVKRGAKRGSKGDTLVAELKACSLSNPPASGAADSVLEL
eukprot:1190914-Prorocentrum_minimum.AAC.5